VPGIWELQVEHVHHDSRSRDLIETDELEETLQPMVLRGISSRAAYMAGKMRKVDRARPNQTGDQAFGSDSKYFSDERTYSNS